MKKKKTLPANYRRPDYFGKLLGYRVLTANKKKKTAKVALNIKKRHLSPAGRVHGGVISSFFDFACGVAVFTTLDKNDFCSTVELKVNFLYPINLNDRLTANTEVVFRGKRLCVVRGTLFKNRERAPTAIATATFNIISR